MPFSLISDIHIKCPKVDPDGQKIIGQFFDHPLVKKSEKIFFLGDIFDLMVGQHHRYLKRFSFFFNELKKLCLNDQKIYYFEGNHDVNIELLLEKFCDNEGVNPNQLMYFKNPQVLTIDGKKFYFSHGDELDQEDRFYQNYKKLAQSSFGQIVCNHYLPLGFVDFVGNFASSVSKSFGKKKFDEEVFKEKYRSCLKNIAVQNLDFAICGHTHIKDQFQYNNFTYFNNGHAKNSKTFLHWDGFTLEFINL